MMRHPNIIAAGMAALIAGSALLAPARAEAFSLGNILGGIILKEIFTDRHTMEERQEDMLRQLGKSSLLLNSSILDIMEALQLDPKLLASRRLIYENLKKDSLNIDNVRASVREPLPMAEMQSAAHRTLVAGNEAKIARINESVKSAKKKRAMSQKAMLLAGKDAFFIMQHVARGDMGEDGDMQDLFDFYDVAREANGLIKEQDAQVKELDKALAEYEKSQDIKPPSDKEAEKEMEGWTPE